MGPLEIFMIPSNGRPSSTTRKMEVAIDSAQTKRTTTTVAFRGAKSPKLTKMRLIQKTRSTTNGVGMELLAPPNRSQRVRCRSPTIWSARDWSPRWASFEGDKSADPVLDAFDGGGRLGCV